MIIQAQNIHKYYNKLHVLKGVNLTVNEGEIISIVGSSGAGKTTLLQILGTLDRPEAKAETRICIAGTDTNTLSDKELSRFRNKNIGFIFQFHQLLPEFTALENICLPGFIGQKNKSDLIAKATELMTYLKIVGRKDHKPQELSGGEQQRVSIARALINQPKVIFADEPSGNLDSVSADELHQLFFDLRDRFGQTFILVTHNKKLADLTDRTLTIKDGIIL